MNRIIVIFLFLNITLLSASQSIQKVSIQLQWKHQFEFAGYYMAKEKGFYKDIGVEIELKEFQYDMDIADDVSKGLSTFGVNYSSLIIEKTKGKEVVLLSAIFQSSPHILISLKSSGIKSIENFKNRKIMIDENAYKSSSIISMLESHNISMKNMVKIKHTFDINDLIADKTDLITSFKSNEPYTLQRKGIEYDIWDPRDYGFDFYDGILFTSNSELKSNPQRVEAFRDASLKGWKYAFEHIDETVELILQKYNTQNKTKEALIYEAKVLKDLAYLNGNELGNINKSKTQSIYDIYKIVDYTNSALNMDELIFTEEEDGAVFNRFEKSI